MLEAEAAPGGPAASHVEARGFTWDTGGPVRFRHHSYYDRVLDKALGDRWLWHERESWIRIRNRFVPCPFQNNIHGLNPAVRDRALAGLKQARSRREGMGRPANFAAWINQTFGDGIAGMFMRPYNLKAWGYPLEELDAGRIDDRVALPGLDRINDNIARRRDDVSWGPNRRFRFPAAGGTGAIWSEIARLLPAERLAFGQRVARIDLDARLVRLEDGQQHRFDVLLSTMPLDVLTAVAGPLAPEVRQAGRSLRYSMVHVLGVKLRGPRPPELTTKCWMYFPESHGPYYRVTVFSNYSPRNVPEGDNYWSLMAEVCESPMKPVDAERLQETVLTAMRQDRLRQAGTDVVSFWHGRASHGYPTPFLGRDLVLDQVLPALEARRVFSRGRFGGWKFEVSNQDHSCMQGVEWADFVVGGLCETTFRDLRRADSGVFLRA